MAASYTMITSDDFEHMVRNSIGQLLEAHGFRQVDEWPFRIRYDGHGMFVVVEYESSRSREMTVWLSDGVDANEPPLTLQDALRATDCEIADIERITRSQTGNPEFMNRLLADVRMLLERYLQPFIRGERNSLLAARAIMMHRAASYTAEMQRKPVLEAAAAAWESKDYGRVHDLLNPIKDSLDEVQLRRLEFAEKRML